MSQHFDLLIVGAGVTGMSAARQAVKHGLSVAILEAQFFGGLIVNINHLDGETSGSGTDLAMELMSEACDLGAEQIAATVSSIDSDAHGLTAASDEGMHRARSILIASGARLKRLGIPGEAELEDKGVSRCADCDGPLFSNQDVVVVGGGDSALQEALALAGFARRVHLVHRDAWFSARPHLVRQLAAQANISVHWRTRVEAILGTNAVAAVRLRTEDDAASTDLACSGFFAYAGLEPVYPALPPQVQREVLGHLRTDAQFQTGLHGLFAAGAVRAGYGGLLTHAVAEGTAAADAAIRMLRS